MARSIVLGTVGLLALGAVPIDAQEPPALEAPAQAAADAPPIPPAAEPPRTPPPSRPLLVIPGVTAPASPHTARKPALDAVETPAARSTLPALDGPDAGLDIPLRLESIPDGPKGDRSEASPRRPATSPTPREDPSEAESSSSGWRRPNVNFGRLRGASESVQAGRDGLTVESQGDPAVEAAVKRRVEKQVRESLGDRVKDVRVRVSGRSVVIQARPSRFWYRWSARRALDALTIPAGYRAHVDLID
ncbi:hypothetical protein [Planctomyces sp. SH-PL62]|uniref:hypothetical protein n=1 Tax=Planctomyces sp. SH-PL62 TaxID=1636152 RepID=UPI00078BE707|nr:hypothetical protein [Planctomyces sp. SH-PL62]AMV38148.1 hypothetical protein VT85_11970 [Planctomyces sp. SH-PL62]